MAAKPMLGGVALQQVQTIEGVETEVLKDHAIPAMEGDFLQDLGRRAARIRVTGVLTGPTSLKDLDGLRTKFKAAAPVDFVADIATATRIRQMLIEKMWSRELAGKPQRFEYAISLVESIGATKATSPAPLPRPAPPRLNTGRLQVRIAGARSVFDPAKAVIRLKCAGVLNHHGRDLWIEENLPPGKYTIRAAVTEPQMAGFAEVQVRPMQTARITITPTPGATVPRAFVLHFDAGRSFLEPSLFGVLQQAAQYAKAHPNDKLLVAGHADAGGDKQYGQLLSEQRARAVYAALTLGGSPEQLLNEWNDIRKSASAKGTTWDARECGFILQDLGYYRGPINGDPQSILPIVRDFQLDHELEIDFLEHDETWRALLGAYLEGKAFVVAPKRFLSPPYLALGAQHLVRNTANASRPNRRVEILFFPSGTQPSEPATWIVVPAEPRSITVRGSISLEDGAPLAGMPYELITPEGEVLHGRTSADGIFGYPQAIASGVYTLNLTAPYVARLAGDPPSAAKGPSVSKYLDASSEFDVLAMPRG
jgi:outer membrane protein OmpA-like peptidoglycan-associated protein